jgi:hypothetical protein
MKPFEIKLPGQNRLYRSLKIGYGNEGVNKRWIYKLDIF